MTLRDKMLAVIADVNASVAEREELVEMIAIALLTRKNLFVLGEPGQAKSYAINLFRQHITGARQFERLLSKQSDEEQLFGRVDLASLLPGSVPPTVLEQDATYQNQRFNLRVLVEGIGSMKDEPATWESWSFIVQRSRRFTKASPRCRQPAKFQRPISYCWMRSSSATMAC